MVMLAFEAINQCRLSIRIGRVDVGAASTLAFDAEAWAENEPSTEAKPLACVRWKVGSTDRRSVDALILQLMYKLDAEMARGEFQKVINEG
jgi:hypothetical protein